jgi:hypothetical protein
MSVDSSWLQQVFHPHRRPRRTVGVPKRIKFVDYLLSQALRFDRHGVPAKALDPPLDLVGLVQLEIGHHTAVLPPGA